MARFSSALLVVVALGLGACAMEQYHFPQTQDKVPANVIVAFSEAWPNDVIKSINESKMFDGSVQYTFVSTNAKLPTDRMTTITAGGKVLPNPPL